MLIELRKTDIEQNEYLIWNSYIHFIATTPYEELNDVQRVAHLCFWYDSEVQNGGHLQYFENRRALYIEETLKSLSIVKGYEQKEILQKAYKQYRSKFRTIIRTVQEFVNTAREGEYEELDNTYYNCQPRLIDLMNNYLQENVKEFIKIID
ncbi:DMP19 family protein [Paenibacillus puerhi]|uniref:DMP19 family protein n=1 Tax=Paenibacillus puerhi TaxID=2692622 RepID=UPI0013578A3D|nr:DUF4375 domain-containing protein [Paenibacillus puerhi]